MARNLQTCHGQSGECYWDTRSRWGMLHRPVYRAPRAPARTPGNKRSMRPPNFFRQPPTTIQSGGGKTDALLQWMDVL